MKTADESLRIIASGGGLMFIGMILSKILGYLYRIIVARIGTAEYGLLSVALAVYSIFVVMALLGMDQGLLRYVSYFRGTGDEQKTKGVIKSTFKITTTISLILAVLLFLFAKWISINVFHEARLTNLLRILAAVIPLDVLRNNILSIIKAFQKVKYFVYSKIIIENSVKVVLTPLLIYLGFNMIGAAFAYAVAILLSLLASVYFLKSKIPNMYNKDVKAVYINNEIIRYSLPLFLSSIIILIILWTDTIILGYYKTVEEVGLYNAAAPTAHLTALFPNALLILFLPVLTELYAKNEKEVFSKIYKAITKWIFLVNIMFLFLIIVFSKQILNILFGTEYIQSSSALIILVIGTFIYHLTLTCNNVLSVLKRTKTIFLITFIGATLNIILNLYLIPDYGLIGASIATSISFSLMGLFMLLASIKASKIMPFKLNYIKISLCVLITLFFIRFIIKLLPDIQNIYMLIIFGLLSLIIYLALLLFTKSFEEEDAMIIESISNKMGMKNTVLNRLIKRFTR